MRFCLASGGQDRLLPLPQEACVPPFAPHTHAACVSLRMNSPSGAQEPSPSYDHTQENKVGPMKKY